MANSKPWFVIAGGGTGGHLYPGLAVAESLRALQPDFEVSVFGTARPIDRKLCELRRYELVAQEVRPFPGRIHQWPGFLAAWFRSVQAARRRFEQRLPAVVLGLGGYAAGPPITAAARMGVPTALFNPDAVPGRANRRLAPRVDSVFVQWDATREHFPKARDVRCTGCPIRRDFLAVRRPEAVRLLKLDPARHTLLVTGASQGARSINLAVLELMELWRVAKEWQIVHLTGDADFEACRGKYQAAGVTARVVAYTEQMATCMAAADLVISRAGASTLAEVTAMGLPSVLMPYPFDRHKHQNANADVLEQAGAAVVVADGNDPVENARRLLPILRDLMKSPERRRRMSQSAQALGRTDAADVIAGQLFEMARRAG